jgi:hypothetical protein
MNSNKFKAKAWHPFTTCHKITIKLTIYGVETYSGAHVLMSQCYSNINGRKKN